MRFVTTLVALVIISLTLTTEAAAQCTGGTCQYVGVPGSSPCYLLGTVTCTAVLGQPGWAATAPFTVEPWGQDLECDACASDQDGGPFNYSETHHTGWNVCVSVSGSVTGTVGVPGWASAGGTGTAGGQWCYNTQSTVTISGQLNCDAGTKRLLYWTLKKEPGEVKFPMAYSKKANWTLDPAPESTCSPPGPGFPPLPTSFVEGPIVCSTFNHVTEHTKKTYTASVQDLECDDEDEDEEEEEEEGDGDGDGDGSWPGSMSWLEFLDMMESIWGVDLSQCAGATGDGDDSNIDIVFLSAEQIEELSFELQQRVLTLGQVAIVSDGYGESDTCDAWRDLYDALYGEDNNVRFRLTPNGLSIDGYAGVLFQTVPVTIEEE